MFVLTLTASMISVLPEYYRPQKAPPKFHEAARVRLRKHRLLDHFISTTEERERKIDMKSLGCVHIDDELDLGSLLDR